jgi:hypothetical protein
VRPAFSLALAERSEAHAVRVARQHLVTVEQQIKGLIEGNFVTAEQSQAAALADALERRVNGVDVHGVGRLPLETEQDSAIRAVAASRQGERAVQLYDDLPRLLEQAGALQIERASAPSCESSTGRCRS